MESQVDSGGVTSKPASGEVPEGVHRHATLDRRSTTRTDRRTQQTPSLPRVRPALAHAHEDPGTSRAAGLSAGRPRRKPKLEPFLPIIHEILKQDQHAPRKQRHTAKRIFDRLQAEHGYDGGYTIIKDAVRAWRKQHAEAFMPLSHRPGEAQVDFGYAYVILNGEQVKVALFVMTLMYSDAVFCCVYPRECSETFLDGHRRAFEFFGGVPRRIAYDNTKTAIKKIVGKRKRELTRDFLRLQSHYLFD